MTRRWRGALVAASVLTSASAALAAPVLRSADIHVTIASPTACEVTMALTIDGASEIEHRVEMFDSPAATSSVELVAVRGAQQIGEVRRIGRTQSLKLRPERTSYEIQYRAVQPVERAERCPLWLPTVPADGVSRAVRVQLELPPAAVPTSSMPTFTWAGVRGSTTLGHIPAFVRVSYGSAGEAPGFVARSLGGGIADTMDVLAVAVFAGASAIWVWRRKRR